MNEEQRAEIHPGGAVDNTVPRSWSGLVGVISFITVTLWVCQQAMPTTHRVLWCLLGTALPMIAFDLAVVRVHRRASAEIDVKSGAVNWRRVVLKSVGLWATIALIAAAYGIFKEYHGSFYDPFWAVLRVVGAPFALLSLPYIAWVDCRMRDPRDGYWHLGAAIAGSLLGVPRSDVDSRELARHGRAWLVKAFFWPLMVVYLSQNLSSIAVKMTLWHGVDSFSMFYDLAWLGMYTVDVGFAAVGYAMTFRLLDAHTRSAEPTVLGWMLCLMCYQPFWGVMGRMYLSYDDNHTWGAWLSAHPVIHGLWGAAILALTFVYVWSTVSFGLRFSNLTHRGVLSFGPYRWLRHPAYVSKNLSWWLVSIPFIPTNGGMEAIRACAALLLVNAVYALRAWTEERHLGADPAYRSYQKQTPWFLERIGQWFSARRQP